MWIPMPAAAWPDYNRAVEPECPVARGKAKRVLEALATDIGPWQGKCTNALEEQAVVDPNQMEKYLFNIRYSFSHRTDGITVTPGVVPEMVGKIENATVKVKRPDGKTTSARVSGISPLCQHPDERLALCLAGALTLDDVPAGSEVYLVSEPTKEDEP